MTYPTETRTSIDYRTDLVEDRRLCDREPTITVLLYRQTTTTERRADGTTVTTEDREQLVASWTYQHPKDDGR